MQSVYEYLDYRQYLRAYHEKRKMEVPHCTYRNLADFFGMDTANMFRILKGKAHLPVRSHSRAIEYLGLAGREAEYFLLLISHSRERHAGMRRELLEKALAIRETAGSIPDQDHMEPSEKDPPNRQQPASELPRVRREVSSMTFAADPEALRAIQELLLDCRARIQRRIELVDEPDRFLRLEMTISPVERTTVWTGELDPSRHSLSFLDTRGIRPAP